MSHRTARVYFSDRLRETESGVLFSKTPSCVAGSAASHPPSHSRQQVEVGGAANTAAPGINTKSHIVVGFAQNYVNSHIRSRDLRYCSGAGRGGEATQPPLSHTEPRPCPHPPLATLQE